MPCKMPVYNKFASAAAPRFCGADARIFSLVPYVDGERADHVCLKHACELATWRLVQGLPDVEFSDTEQEMLLAYYGEGIKKEMPIVFDETIRAQVLEAEKATNV